MAPLIKENSVLSYTNLYVARCFRNAFVCMLLKQKELPCKKGDEMHPALHQQPVTETRESDGPLHESTSGLIIFNLLMDQSQLKRVF